MKKILLLTSSIIFTTMPIIAVVSCGADENEKRINYASSLLQRDVLFGKTNTLQTARQVKYSENEDAIYNDLFIEQISEKLNDENSFIELKDSKIESAEWWEDKDVLRDVLFLTTSSIPSLKAFNGTKISYRIDFTAGEDNIYNVKTSVKIVSGNKSTILNYYNFGIADSKQSDVDSWAKIIQKSFASKTLLITLKTEAELNLIQKFTMTTFTEIAMRELELVGYLDYSINATQPADIKTEYTLIRSGMVWVLDIHVTNTSDESKVKNLTDITIRQRNADELIQGIETELKTDIKSQQNGNDFISSAKAASAIPPIPTSNIQADLGLRPSFKMILDKYAQFGVEATYTTSKKNGLYGAKYVVFLNLSKESAQRAITFNLRSLDYVSSTGQAELDALIDSLSFETPSFTNEKLASLQTTSNTIFNNEAKNSLGLIGDIPSNPNGFELTYTFVISPHAVNGQRADYILTIKGHGMGLVDKTTQFIFTSSDLYENDSLIVQTVKESIIRMYGAELSTLTSRSVQNDSNINSSGTASDFETSFDFGQSLETIPRFNSIITWTYTGGSTPTIELSIVKNEVSALIYYRVQFHSN